MQPVIPRTTSGRALRVSEHAGAREHALLGLLAHGAGVDAGSGRPPPDRRCARSRRDRADPASDRCRRRSSGSRRSRRRPFASPRVDAGAICGRCGILRATDGGGSDRSRRRYNPGMHRSARVVSVAFVSLLAATFVATSDASAAAPWIYRGLDASAARHRRRLRHGLRPRARRPATGLGMNLELRAGVTHDFELGFRMGFRLDDGGQITQADCYGRPFDTETYGTRFDRVANPEIRLRWSMARSYAAELGLRAALLPADRDRVALRLHVRPADRAARRADPLRHRPLRPDHLLRSDARRSSASRSTSGSSRRATSGWARCSGCAS